MNATVPALLLYPLRRQGGVMLLIWSVALYGALVLVDALRHSPVYLAILGLFLGVAAVISLGVFLLYAWATLRHVAAGHVEPIRNIEVNDIHPFLNLLGVKVAFLLLGIAGFVHWVFMLNPIAGWVASLAIGSLLPAIVGVVVLEERLLSLLDGRTLRQFVRGLGATYAGFAAAIYAGVVALYLVCLNASSPNMVAVALASYVFVFGHALAGRLVYLRSNQLRAAAPPLAPTPPKVAVDNGQRLEPLLVELHRLCGVDRVAEAGRKLEAFLSVTSFAGDEPAHQRLLQFHDRRLLLEHSWHYLNRLVAAHNLPRAWLLLREALAIDAMFRPATDTMVLDLIAVAPERDAPWVDSLLSDFTRAYPQSERVDDALFAHAQVLLTAQLARHEAALAVLEQIATQFPARAQRSDFAALHAQTRRFIDAGDAS